MNKVSLLSRTVGRTLGFTMPENANSSPLATDTDYEFMDNMQIIGATYVVCSVVGVFLNTLVLLTVFKSRRMPQTPKYWMVVIVSITYWLQATLTNPQMVATWFDTRVEMSCGLWLTAAAYNRHICVGLACWCSMLINLDYFLCVMFRSYRQRYRVPVTVSLLLTSFLVLIVALVVVLALHGSTKKPIPVVSCHLGFTDSFVAVVMFGYTTYAPLAAAAVLVLLTVMVRSSGTLKHLFGLERLIDASLGFDSYNVFPPLDHTLNFLTLVLFYMPAALITHLVLEKTISPGPDQPWLLHLATAVAVMRDNAGCLVPLVWFCFEDMRNTFRRLTCSCRRPQPSDSAFEESSEFRVYETYPYCANAQV